MQFVIFLAATPHIRTSGSHMDFNQEQHEEYLRMTERVGEHWLEVFRNDTDFWSAVYWDLFTKLWQAHGPVRKTDALRYMTAVKSAHTAGKYLETAIGKARRNLGVSYCNYAVTLMHANQPQEALRHFDTAAEVDPANASFYLSNKAHALSELGLTDKAKSLYERVLQQPSVTKETRRIVLKNLKDITKK